MSYESIAGLIEMAFFYSIALGFGIWQVVKMRREIARDRLAREMSGKAEKTDKESDKSN